MTTPNFRVVADRDAGDDPKPQDVQVGDRYVLNGPHLADTQIVRIERADPTVDEHACGNCLGVDPASCINVPTRQPTAEPRERTGGPSRDAMRDAADPLPSTAHVREVYANQHGHLRSEMHRGEFDRWLQAHLEQSAWIGRRVTDTEVRLAVARACGRIMLAGVDDLQDAVVAELAFISEDAASGPVPAVVLAGSGR